MKKICTVIALLALAHFSKAQLNMAYSFSSVGSLSGLDNANLSTPIILSGESECYTLQSGLTALYGERKDGIFMVDCKVTDPDNIYGFTLFPNPVSAETNYVITFRSRQRPPSGYYSIDVLGLDGIPYLKLRVSADEIYSGIKIDMSPFSAAGYVFLLNGDSLQKNLIFIKVSQ